jgi:dihydrofolate reductase
VWTASTIKLAMVVDLLTRQRAGSLTLTDSDKALIGAILHSSDDDAADTLWSRYGGADHQSYNSDFPRYGMTDLQPQRGFSATYPYWGFQKSTPDDLDRLINYTLTQLDPAETARIDGQLQHVDANQQWGIWGADATAITDYLNQVAKYVVSSTMTDPQWRNSTVFTGDPVERTRALKAEPGKDILLTGSISLAHTLIAGGLVDEYRVFVYPAVQGRGRRLFPDGTVFPRLSLLEAKSFKSGIMLLRYAAS